MSDYRDVLTAQRDTDKALGDLVRLAASKPEAETELTMATVALVLAVRELGVRQDYLFHMMKERW